MGFAVGASWSAKLEVGTKGSCVIGRKQLDVAGGGTTWVDLMKGNECESLGLSALRFSPTQNRGKNYIKGAYVRHLSRVLVRSQRNDGSKEYPD